MSNEAPAYGVPTGNREVICMHCSDIYNESELIFETRLNNPTPLWWCRNGACDGAGFRHDIYPTEDEFMRFFVEQTKWHNAWKAEHGYCARSVYTPIEEVAMAFAPRKKLTVKHKLKKRVLKRFDDLKAGKA